MDKAMDNQQVNTKAITWQWLAGFYDGEGCLNLTHNKSKRLTAFSPQIDLVNTNQPAMELIISFLEAHEIPVYVNKSKKHARFHRDSGRSHKQRMTIRIARMKSVKRFLEYLKPHLVLKREQAELLLEFVSSRAEGYTRTTERDFEIYKRLRELNGKGDLVETSEANTPGNES